jgi:putative two-component system response regulator
MLNDLAADLRGVSQIVVASDDADALQSLVTCLQRAGYSRLQVSPTAAVIAALSSVNPDIVLLDASDSVDAVELVKGIRREMVGRVHVPIVVVEADPSPEARWRGLLAGADDVVSRPFDATEVFLRIQNLLRVRWLHCAVQSKSRALEVQLQERTRALFASRLELIDRLAAAIEIRDGYTGHHTRRVGAMAARIAEVYGEPPDSVERIRLAAPLHDIGKIGIPDSLLAKPGRLTLEEMRVMQRHTVIGWELLSSGVSDVMVAAARIARSHHERWDGTGYPDAIAGEAIPLYARIVGVADVYDSLIFDRPYRRAMSREQAMAEMERGAGSHFDPELLTVFRTVVESGQLN